VVVVASVVVGAPDVGGSEVVGDAAVVAEPSASSAGSEPQPLSASATTATAAHLLIRDRSIAAPPSELQPRLPTIGLRR
jgi:hypothetical protein